MSLHRRGPSLRKRSTYPRIGTGPLCACCSFFFFNDTATTEIYTLSLHDALPICTASQKARDSAAQSRGAAGVEFAAQADRKSTRLNSSHLVISYAVFCLKKKKAMAS